VLHAGLSNVLPTPDGLDTLRRRIELNAGAHAIKVAAKGDGSGKPVQLRLNWVTPEQRQADYAAALAAAKAAKKVVVFAWSRGRPEPFMLPGEQNKLIADIAAVNPNTIVVLNTSQAVALPWLDRVKGVLEMWYTGDEGGAAAANLLLGKANPAGRLPFTWPRSFEQLPANDPQYPERSTPDAQGVTHYSEGVLVGYRWFDAQQIAPLFPFGYGLSYARFDYSDLQTQRSADGGLDVSFTVRNSSAVAGDEVPQIYLGAPEQAVSNAQFAARSLLAFDRQTLQAGEQKRIVLHVPLRDLQYWSTDQNAWRLAPGKRILYVGASSRDLRLQTDVVLDSNS
jgi:beta-glucosidase